MKTDQRGFTLIEMMIVVAILAILASIALSSYQSQTLQSRRSLGSQALLETAQRLEQCQSESLSYTTADGCTVTLPFDAPRDSSTKYYTISSTARTASTYTLAATAINVQASDTDCAVLNLNHLGQKTATTTDCW